MRLWRGLGLAAVCCVIFVTSGPASRAQQEQPESHRKMLNKVVPMYPSLAQKMGISGSVKIEAVVAANGTVKSAEILGGHPVLAQAGVDAVRQCKWETSPRETHEVVVLNFHPE
jgi:TonB family protein